MTQNSSIQTVAEWVSPVTGIVVDFYRDYSLRTYRNPSLGNLRRLANLIKSKPDVFKVTPWSTGGIVGWYADVQRELSESPLTDSEKGV